MKSLERDLNAESITHKNKKRERSKVRGPATTLLAIGLSFHSGISLGEETAFHGEARLWVGYGRDRMDDFNRAQAADGNEKLTGGFEAGIEFSPLFIELSDIPWLKNAIFSLPLGIEFFNASTKKTHTIGADSATVAWNLDVVGIYVSPEVKLPSPAWLTLQPIELGYFTIGDLVDAHLTISDRPGHLEVRGQAVGVRSGITIEPFPENIGVYMSLGYRWLRFSDVKQEPKDGFQYSVGGTASPPGRLQQDLDYSGFTVRIGIARSF